MRYSKLIVVMCLILAVMSGCKVKEAAGAYRPAKAKVTTTSKNNQTKKTEPVVQVQEVAPTPEPQPVVEEKKIEVTPPEPVLEVEESVVAAPVEEEKIVTRSETVSVIEGQNTQSLKDFNVVIGSFGSKANAERLQSSMQPAYSPIIVINEKGMYRVILSSFDDYASARSLINQIKDKFPDAWVLRAN